MNKLPINPRNALIDGLSALFILRLPYSPSSETIKAVAKVWEQALIEKGYAWDDEDAMRLAKAFARFTTTAERWPLPKQIIDLMPLKIKHQKSLSEPAVKVDLKAVKMLEELCQKLGIKKKR